MKTNKKGVVLVRMLDMQSGNRRVECKCPECEELFEMWASHFYRGTNSCHCQGHRKKERLYSIWTNMKTRCSNPNTPNYKNYGGKGVTITKDWANNYSLFKTWALNNGYKPNLSIDRIDGDGNYEPSNCRWVTDIEQANNKSDNINITINGETKSMKRWCEESGLKYKTEYSYYKKNGLDRLVNRLKNNKKLNGI